MFFAYCWWILKRLWDSACCSSTGESTCGAPHAIPGPSSTSSPTASPLPACSACPLPSIAYTPLAFLLSYFLPGILEPNCAVGQGAEPPNQVPPHPSAQLLSHLRNSCRLPTLIRLQGEWTRWFIKDTHSRVIIYTWFSRKWTTVVMAPAKDTFFPPLQCVFENVC